MRTLRPTRLATLLLGLLAACGRDPTPTAPPAARPSFTISDGAHGGNPNFFFLPPLLPSPTGSPNFRAGQFNPRLTPTVEICRLLRVNAPAGDGHCDAQTIVARWSESAVKLSVTDEQYQVNWKTDSVALDLDAIYRIRVLVGDRELGFADIDPVTKDQLKNYRTGDLIPLLPGRTLPVKFRIQNGALAGAGSTDYVERNVPRTGGTDTVTILINRVPTLQTGTLVTTGNRQAGAFFPNGWLPQTVPSVAVSISRVPVPPGQTATTCHNTPGLVEFEGCYHYATYPTLPYRTDTTARYVQFYKPVTVEMCTTLPVSDPRYDGLSLFKSGPTEPLTVLPEVDPKFVLTCDQFAPSRASAPQVGLRPAGAFARLAAGVDAATRAAWGGIAAALTPKSAYAVDLGAGGTAFAFSNIGFGIRQSLTAAGPADLTPAPGAVAPAPFARVRVVAEHDHAANGQLTAPTYIGVPGVTVTFAVTAGGGTVPNIALPGGAGASTAVVTDSLGYARVPWTLGSAGANALTATIMGGMALPYAGSTTATFTATVAPAAPAPRVSIGGVVRDRTSQAAIPQALAATLTAVDGSGATRAVNYVGGTTGSLADTLRADVPADAAFLGRPALLTITFASGGVAQTRTALVDVPAAVAGHTPGVVHPFTVSPLSVAITGTLTGQDQRTPVAGALVRVGLRDGTAQATAAVTAADGSYALYLQQGDTTLAPNASSFFAADRPGFVTLRDVYAPITPGRNQTANLSVLPNGAAGVLAQAQVLTNDPRSPGAAVAGVAVVVRVDSLNTPDVPNLAATTDAWGRFRLFIPFAAVAPGRSVLYGPQFSNGYVATAQQPMPSAATYFTTGFVQPYATP